MLLQENDKAARRFLVIAGRERFETTISNKVQKCNHTTHIIKTKREKRDANGSNKFETWMRASVSTSILSLHPSLTSILVLHLMRKAIYSIHKKLKLSPCQISPYILNLALLTMQQKVQMHISY